MTTSPPPPPPPPPEADVPSAAWAVLPTPGGAAGIPAPPVAPPVRPTVNGMAVASLVLGLCCWCFFVPGILAVIFGNLALGRIATSDGRQSGRGMAIAGIVLGWVSIAVLAGLMIAWLVYGLTNL